MDMAKVILLITARLLAMSFASSVDAKTILVKLTSQQVATVCGSGLKSNAGASGCFKKCGNYPATTVAIRANALANA
jgi:hypothetical protein